MLPQDVLVGDFTTSLPGPTFYSNPVGMLLLLGTDQSRTNTEQAPNSRKGTCIFSQWDLKGTFSKHILTRTQGS